MSLKQLIDALPGYAGDQKQNLAALAAETILSGQQKWGCFLACAYTAGEPVLIKALEHEADLHLSVDAISAVKSAAAIMAMNTIYYRATNLLQNHDYRAEPVNLVMAALANPGVDKIDFELWAFAVSAFLGCGACMNTHEMELHKRGVSLVRVQTAIRIAAVINAVSVIQRVESGSTF